MQTVMLKTLIGKFKYAMLFCFAAFENKGDPSITVGELNIIRKLGIKLFFSVKLDIAIKGPLWTKPET